MSMSQDELRRRWEARHGRRTGGPENKEAIPYDAVHGSTTPTGAYHPPAQIAGRKADPGAVLRQTLAIDALEAQIRRMQADEAIRAEITYLQANVEGALLALPPTDPTAPRPPSAAELRYREDLEWDFVRRQMREMGR